MWISLFLHFSFSIYFVMIPLFKNSESWDILASPMGIRFCACSIRGLGSIPWSGNSIPQATTKDQCAASKTGHSHINKR